MKAEALAELDAEDSDDDYCYISRPNDSLTPPKGFVYKNPVLCAAHVHGIADPAMYGNHRSYNSREVFNKHLKLMHEKEKKDKLKDEIQAGEGVMDRAAAQLILTRTQTGMTTNACDVEFFLEHMDRRVGGECSDLETPAESLYNAQGKLAFERARFRADCAARAIRNAADAEKHKCRIAVARAEVVRQKKKLPLHVTLP